MRKLALLMYIMIGILTATSLSIKVSAFDPLDSACNGVSDSTVCNDRQNTSNPVSGPEGIIVKAANLVLYVVGVAAVVMIIYGGIKMITSQGDPKGFSGGRDTIIAALVGVLIAILAKAIVQFFVERTIK